MPYVNVKIAGQGVSAEQKQEVMAGISEVLYQVLGKPHKATYVVIEEVDTDNWGVGKQSLTTIRSREE